MSKPITPRVFFPAVCVVAVTVVAAAILIKVSPAKSGGHGNPTASKAMSRPQTVTPADHARINAAYAALPLAFEANQGQVDPQVKYMARATGYKLFLTNHDAVFSFHSQSSASGLATRHLGPELKARNLPSPSDLNKNAVVRMRLVGANSAAQVAATDELPGKTNYYLGNDPKNWHTNVSQYARVSYKNVYPGIDLTYYGERSKLEFDFIVAPESNPAPINLAFSGAQSVATDASGNLAIASAAGDVVLHKPVAYQQHDGARELIDARFVLEANNQVTFELGSYDHSRELVIDPSVTYATYLGGAAEDEVYGLAVDSAKSIYVTGESDSTSGWPTSAGGNVPSGHGFDAFVTKFTSAGVISYTTFVGGTGTDTGLAIAVDSSHAAYVAGTTQSADFPASGTAPEPTTEDSGSCTNTKAINSPCSDAFAFKLNATGASVWATYIGGSNDDDGYAIAVDGGGNTWVAGDSFSANFYPISHATTTLYANFNNGGTLSPPADDGFVVEINPTGTAPFLFATYLGGSFGDQVNGIAIDGSNNIYVAGETNSKDFPTTAGAYQKTCGSDGNCNANGSTSYYDAFVAKIPAGGGALTYSTYVGGSSDDYAFAIALDSSGDAYITGSTSADDTTTTPAVPYPTTTGAFSTSYNASATSNAFVTELNPSASALVYSTFLGGSTQDFGGGIAVDSLGDAYATGVTLSTNFPVTSNAVQSQLNGSGTAGNSDAFVTQVLAGGSKLGFSTYFGGSLNENADASGAVGTIALDSSNNIWFGGSTNSTNFPVTATTAAQPTYGGNPYDGFVAEISSATVPDFSITAAVAVPGTVAPGGSATSAVTLSELFNYNSLVNLTCSVSGGGSPAPTCSFSPTSVTPTSAGAPSTLTITTTGSSASVLRPSKFFYAMWLPIAGFSLMGMGFSSARSRRKKLLGFLMVGMVMAALFLMPACGGGSSGGGGGGGGCTGCTPAGNYTVTITGTDANSLSHSTTVALTVN